ncbi:DUF2931 family protein [Shewanella sp. MMG014]|uniref:DUF2931 family protein n=1 Tax=Shewanella sp. MMG014 TaxID=2822691 RepID=UPI001B396DE8|nr:DUF2931 family protein [Shewanella sp. MMG014]MBQ4892321.1 DUF2931 family protein [Shewanella sp. MMG014]
MKVNRKKGMIFGVVSALCVGGAFLIKGCASHPDIPEDMRAWRIGVVSPSFYPVRVQQAYGVNDRYNWTSLTHGFNALWRKGTLDNVRKRLPDYDGFSIPLHAAATSMQGQVMPAKILPDSIYLYWASLAEGKFYATKFDLSPALKQQMMTQERYIRPSGADGGGCYQIDVLFGLLPGGDAKVWLSGCGMVYTYIDKIKPAVTAITDRSGAGVDNFQYKGPIERALQRAADNGVTLFPVPWDKVDQVSRSNASILQYYSE